MIKVTTTMTGEQHTFATMNEAKEHIQTEIRWFNSPRENEMNSGYTEDDFIITVLNQTR